MKTYTTLLLALFAGSLTAQNLTPLNPVFSMLTVNPSYAGISENMRVQSQFSKIFIPSFTGYRSGEASIAADYYDKKTASGLGISANYSNMFGGIRTDRQMSFTYSKHLFLKKKFKLIPSLRYTVANMHMNDTWLGSTGNNNLNYQTLSAGMLFNYKNFYLGYSAHELFNTSNKSSGLLSSLLRNNKWNASYNLRCGKQLLFNFSALYSNYSAFNNWQLSTNAVFCNHFIFGGGVQLNDVSYLAAGYKANRINVMLMSTLPVKSWAGFNYSLMQLNVNARLSKGTQDKTQIQNIETW
ncbi:MAG: type IX secretion system membrane protein PorP/SprF [Bacteroidia bacterium]|nr:type IX secretion system membrane protein PorP/SprF [Bacteroidia bacterium]